MKPRHVNTLQEFARAQSELDSPPANRRVLEALEAFGRQRLSTHFFMRDFLHSEISAVHGIPNIPSDPELALEAGRGLCQELLEPLHRTVGRVVVRSGYRSRVVNAFGSEFGFTPVPASPRTDLGTTPCSARPRAVPAALAPAHAPQRLRTAGFIGVHSPIAQAVGFAVPDRPGRFCAHPDASLMQGAQGCPCAVSHAPNDDPSQLCASLACRKQ